MDTLKLPTDERGFVPDQHRDRFFQLLKSHPDNRSCFDCASRNTSWISTTFGIFLCVTCSGQHRNLGARVSFVRSTDLDRIKLEELVRMEIGGNLRARQFFRAHGLNEGRPTDYRTKVCDRYRKQLDKDVSEILTSQRPDLVPRPPESIDESTTTAGSTTVPAAVSSEPLPASITPSVVSVSPSVESVAKKSAYKPTSISVGPTPSSHYYGSTPAGGAKGSLKAKTVDFDFDFDSAFESSAAATVPSFPSQENVVLDSQSANRIDSRKEKSSEDNFFKTSSLPKSNKDLRNAKAISASDFEQTAPSGEKESGNYSKFRDAQAISSDAFFGGGNAGDVNDLSFEDEASTRISLYSDKAVQKATDLAMAASETLRNAATWFGKVSSSTTS